MKKTWQLINELRGKVKHKNKPSFKIDGQLVHDKRIISNGFIKYFTSIAETMNEELANSMKMLSLSTIIFSKTKAYLAVCFSWTVMKVKSLK